MTSLLVLLSYQIKLNLSKSKTVKKNSTTDGYIMILTHTSNSFHKSNHVLSNNKFSHNPYLLGRLQVSHKSLSAVTDLSLPNLQSHQLP